jgi:REP element-mobilizing transposase RayT
LPSIRVLKELKDRPHFCTFTIKNWYYILDRYKRWEILLESLRYCQEKKDLKIFAFVLMVNHIHIISQCPDMIGFIRDYKRYTSIAIIKNIKLTEPTVANLFIEDDGSYQVWKQGNAPKIVETDKYFKQKREYIENNPVRKGYVQLPEHWIHSSAHKPCLLKIEQV